MTKILITGANSQLGQALVKLLPDTLPKTREQLDITKADKVTEAVYSLRPEFVINTAAPHCGSDNNYQWDVLSTGVDNLLKASAAVGAKFINISSDKVFSGLYTNKLLSESSPVKSRSWKGFAQIAGEHAVLRMGQCLCPDYWKNGFRYWVLRTSTLFNSYDRPSKRSIAHVMLERGQIARKLEVPNDHRISFTYLPHLAKAIKYLVTHHNEFLSGIYNVTNQDSCSAFQFAEHLARGPIAFTPIPVPVHDYDSGLSEWAHPGCVVLDNTKFIEDAGGPKLPTWQEAIEEFWKNYETK